MALLNYYLFKYWGIHDLLNTEPSLFRQTVMLPWYLKKIIKKRLQDRCFSVRIAIFLRTPVQYLRTTAAMHAISGCDSVSSFSNIGKITAFQTWKNKIDELTDINWPPHIRNKPWIGRKNDKAVKVMIKTQILLWKTIEGNRKPRVRVRAMVLLFYCELAPTDPWCNMLQTLLGRNKCEKAMSDEHPQYVCYLYEEKKSGSSVHELRYRMLTKNNLSGDCLPPMLDV